MRGLIAISTSCFGRTSQALLAVTTLVAASLLLAAKPAHADTTFTVDRSDDPDLTTTLTSDDCTTATANDTPGADNMNFANPEDPNDPADGLKILLHHPGERLGRPVRDRNRHQARRLDEPRDP